MKNFLITTITATTLAANALASDVDQPLISSPTASAIEETQAPHSMTSKLWERAKNLLKNRTLSKQLNCPNFELARGMNLGCSYKIKSEPSIAGSYSGIDIWNINLAANQSLLTDNSVVGVGANTSREFTFIQQFKTQKESLLRMPYDPLTKLPKKSSVFFESTKNILTGQQEKVLSEGDFVGFRAPMSIGLSKSNGKVMAGHFGVSAGLSYVLSGEFDIHIFIMKDNFIRTRLVLAQEQTKGMSVNATLLGYNGLGKLVLSRVIDFNLLSIYLNSSKTDLFVADYIFNMNEPESRKLYDQLIGAKLNIYDIDVVKKQIQASNTFSTDNKSREVLIGDLDALNEISLVDNNKPYSERRIIRLSNSHNANEGNTIGMNVNLFKILKFETSETRSGSKITFFAENDEKAKDFVKDRFLVNTITNQDNTKFILWGNRNVTTSTVLTRADESFTSDDFIGLQVNRIRENSSINQVEYESLQKRLNKILPKEIAEQIEFPKWNFNKGKVENVHVQHDVTLSDNLLKLNVGLNQQQIKTVLEDLLNNFGKIKTTPMGASNDTQDPRMKAFNEGKYVEAYSDFEIYLISMKLAEALDARYAFKDRFESLTYLTEKVPLFNEIGAVLLLKLIPPSEYEKTVQVRLSISANDQKSLVADYPSSEAYNRMNLFREVLGQNGYFMDRSYNLRFYIKEDGSLYGLDELVLKSKK